MAIFIILQTFNILVHTGIRAGYRAYVQIYTCTCMYLCTGSSHSSHLELASEKHYVWYGREKNNVHACSSLSSNPHTWTMCTYTLHNNKQSLTHGTANSVRDTVRGRFNSPFVKVVLCKAHQQWLMHVWECVVRRAKQHKSKVGCLRWDASPQNSAF